MRKYGSIALAGMAFFLLTACGGGAARTPQGSLERDDHLGMEEMFQAAATEFSVPPVVLEAVAYVETRWHPARPEAAPAQAGDAHLSGWGVMGLREGEAFGQTLARAARLIGRSPEELKQDTRLNIRGGAALLRELAGKPSPSPRDPADWVEAVRSYSGIAAKDDADAYVQEVYQVIHDGVSGGGIEILPVPVTVPGPAPAPTPSPSASPAPAPTPSKPAVVWDPSPNMNPGGNQPRFIVIHVTQGDYATSVSWLKNPASQVSAHYVVRSRDGLIKQLVADRDKAWHARCWNSQAIGIEHEGFIERPEKYFTSAMYRSSAQLVGYLSAKYAIPRTRIRIIGHDAGDQPWFGQTGLDDCNDHPDPGPGWDWLKYLSLVQAPDAATAAQSSVLANGADAPAERPGCAIMGAPGDGVRCCTGPTTAAYLTDGPTPWCAPARLQRMSDAACDLAGKPRGGVTWRCG
jgi:N-acetyl-anhydromuramyl-L-alanine amidase AmpD